MSLDQGTIETLREQLEKERAEKRGWIRQIDELTLALEKKDETIQTLELANSTLRRRVESLEGVGA